MFFAGGAEFSGSHEDDVLNVGKLVERATIEQITGDRFDPLHGELGEQSLIREPGHCDHALLDARLVDSAPRKTVQAWTHLASCAEEEKVALQRRNGRGGGLVGA